MNVRLPERAAGRTVLLLGALLLAGTARAQPSPPDAGVASQSTAPDVSKGAGEVAGRVRAIMRSLSDEAAMSALESEVGDAARRASDRWEQTSRLLEARLRPTELDSLETSWRALRSDLQAIGASIDARAHRRDKDLETVAGLRDAWTRALDHAREADAPASIQEHAQSTIATIDATRAAIARRRARLAVLADSLSRASQTCDDAIAQIDDERRQAIERVFTPQQRPLWSASTGPSAAGSSGSASSTTSNLELVRIYAATYRISLALAGLVILVSMVLLRRWRSLIPASAAQDGTLDSTAFALRTPYASAVLLGLLVTRPLRPNPPYALQLMTLAVVMTAAILVLRPIVRGRLAGVVYALGALFVIDLMGGLLEVSPRLDQAILTLELLTGAVLTLWGASEINATGTLAEVGQRVRTLAVWFARLIALGCGVSGVAAAFGFVDLARFLGIGLFYGLLMAFGGVAIRVTLDGLLTLALMRGPLARLHTVDRHRAFIGRRIRRLLDVAVVVLWLWFVLDHFELLAPVLAFVRDLLQTRLRAGELDLPVSRVLAFAAVVVGIVIATRVVGTVLEEDVYSRMTLPRGVPYALSTLTRYGLLLVGFLLALATLGLDLTRITVLVSAFGLGLGFGLQQIMNNFVSGLILLFERPVKIGDSIQLGDLGGEVLRIGIRSSTVRTGQGADVIVPNSKMIEEKVTNWTLSDRQRRIELDIGIKGNSDAERIIALMTDVAGRDPRVSHEPPPEALLLRFGEDSKDFQLRFWTDAPNWMRLRSELAIALQRALSAVSVEQSRPTDGS